MLGAPPDAFNADGQAWGIGSYSPAGLRASGFAPFIALLRAVMRGRGGVRIDHILGLLRLWVVPDGASSGDGAYLAYPLQDLLNLGSEDRMNLPGTTGDHNWTWRYNPAALLPSLADSLREAKNAAGRPLVQSEMQLLPHRIAAEPAETSARRTARQLLELCGRLHKLA